VNRQRLAFSQNRLCNDHKDKLLSIGLKLDIFNEKKSLSSNHNNMQQQIQQQQQQQQQLQSLDNDNNLDHYNNVIIDNISSSCQNIISSDESQKKNLHNEFCLTTTTTSDNTNFIKLKHQDPNIEKSDTTATPIKTEEEKEASPLSKNEEIVAVVMDNNKNKKIPDSVVSIQNTEYVANVVVCQNKKIKLEM